eukprot:jgi/Astpho2/8194/Aster-03116
MKGRALDSSGLGSNGAGVLVEHAVSGRHSRFAPHAFATQEAICVFSGSLINSTELGEGSLDAHRGSSGGSKGSVYEPDWGEGSDKEEQPDAELLLRMFLSTKNSDLLILLSELQGQFAFVCYDGNKKQVFAARDPSGSMPLYHSVDEDGAISFCNKLADIPVCIDAPAATSQRVNGE